MQFANSAVIALVGKPWHEIKNRTDAEFLDDADEGVRVMATDRYLIETAGEEELEEVVGNDGSGPRIWLSRKKAVRNPDGLVMGLVGASVDITERKHAEQRLAASEAQLRRVIDNMFAFVGVADVDGVLIEANRASVEGAGLERADVIGRPLWETYWLNHDPAVSASIWEAVQKARERGRYPVGCRISLAGRPADCH